MGSEAVAMSHTADPGPGLGCARTPSSDLLCRAPASDCTEPTSHSQ